MSESSENKSEISPLNVSLSSPAIAINPNSVAVGEEAIVSLLKNIFPEAEKDIGEALTLVKTVINKDTLDKLTAELKSIIVTDADSSSIDVVAFTGVISKILAELKTYFLSIEKKVLNTKQKFFIQAHTYLLSVATFLKISDDLNIFSTVQTQEVTSLLQFGKSVDTTVVNFAQKSCCVIS